MIEDMREDVRSLERQLDQTQNELDCERILREKLDQEVKAYHEASERNADDAAILAQRMRLAESARQSAENRAVAAEATVRNNLLEVSHP